MFLFLSCVFLTFLVPTPVFTEKKGGVVVGLMFVKDEKKCEARGLESSYSFLFEPLPFGEWVMECGCLEGEGGLLRRIVRWVGF